MVAVGRPVLRDTIYKQADRTDARVDKLERFQPAAGTGGGPGGDAAGDLQGTWPTLIIKQFAVTALKIANRTIDKTKIALGTLTDAEVDPVNKDGAAGTPSMRTLGTGAQQAAAGNDARLSDARAPLAHTHPQADIIGLVAALAGKEDAASLSPDVKALLASLASGDKIAWENATGDFVEMWGEEVAGNPAYTGDGTAAGANGRFYGPFTGDFTLVARRSNWYNTNGSPRIGFEVDQGGGNYSTIGIYEMQNWTGGRFLSPSVWNQAGMVTDYNDFAGDHVWIKIVRSGNTVYFYAYDADPDVAGSTPVWSYTRNLTTSEQTLFGVAGYLSVRDTADWDNIRISGVSYAKRTLWAAVTSQAGVRTTKRLLWYDGSTLKSDWLLGDAAIGGDLTGTILLPAIKDGVITDVKVAAANKDGTAGTPSMRTLGTGAQQAAAGNHIHDDRYYTETEADARFAPIGSGGGGGSGSPVINPGAAGTITQVIGPVAAGDAATGVTGRSGQFTSYGGKVKLDVALSAYTTAGGNSTLSVNVLVDGVVVGTLKEFTNENASHKPLIGEFVLAGLAAGDHTVTFTHGANTLSNNDDYVSVTTIETGTGGSAVPIEAWHDVPDSAMSNGVTNYQQVSYRKTNGIVSMRGMLRYPDAGLAANTLIFTLPIGYRPAQATEIPIRTNFSPNTFYALRINPDGSVRVSAEAGWPSGSPTVTYLSNVNFAVDQDSLTVASIQPEAWREIGASGQPPFQNGFSNYDPPNFTTAAFFRDVSGVVHIKGTVVNAASNLNSLATGTIFTLPAGYRPSRITDIVLPANNAYGQIRIYPTGEVFCALGNSSFLELDGITLRADDYTAPGVAVGGDGIGDRLQPGVMGGGDLAMTVTDTGHVSIAAGTVWVRSSSGFMTRINKALPTSLAVPVAATGRLDQVVIDSSGTLSVLAGTVDSGVPTLDNRNGAATVPPGSQVLFDLLVTSGGVTAVNSRDRRPWARGFYDTLQFINEAGDFTSNSAGWTVIDAVRLALRCEFSGNNPVRVKLQGFYTSGGFMELRLWPSVYEAGSAFRDGGPVRFEHEIVNPTPPAGSSLIVPQWHSLGGAMALKKSGGADGGGSNYRLVFEVEEIIRQHANNGVV